MRVGGFLALVILSVAVLSSDACVHRRYTMRVTETVPTTAPRRSAAAPPEARGRERTEQGSDRGVQSDGLDAPGSIVATSDGKRPRPQGMEGSSPSVSEPGSSVVPDREPSTTGGASGEVAVSQPDPGRASPSVFEPVSLGFVVGAGVIALLLLVAAFARRQVRA